MSSSVSHIGAYKKAKIPILAEAVDHKPDYASLFRMTCATGELVLLIDIHPEGKILSGIDIPEQIKRKMPKGSADGGDFFANSDDLPYEKNRFHRIICTSFSSHTLPSLTVLRKMKRVIKHGGYLILAGPWRKGYLKRWIYSLYSLVSGTRSSLSMKETLTARLGRCGFFIERCDYGINDVLVITAKAIK
jgi:hypothetical protein